MFLSCCAPRSVKVSGSFFAPVRTQLARDADAARLGDALQACGDVDAVAVDARLVVDDIAEVDADAELHPTICFDGGVALGHRLLDGDRALDRVHDAGELGEDAVAGRVDDAAAVLGDHRQHDRLMRLEVADGTRLVSAHQRAVAGDVGGEDCGQPALNLGVPGAVCRH